MSTVGSAQLSPRVISACERLDEAVGRLSSALKVRAKKVDAREVDVLNGRIEGLEADNLALSKALEAYNDADYDSQFEKLNDEIDQLRLVNEGLSANNAEIRDVNQDVSEQLSVWIDKIESVLEEEE